jgi:hypothetical protein
MVTVLCLFHSLQFYGAFCRLFWTVPYNIFLLLLIFLLFNGVILKEITLFAGDSLIAKTRRIRERVHRNKVLECP